MGVRDGIIELEAKKFDLPADSYKPKKTIKQKKEKKMMIASIVADSAPESKRDDIEQEIMTDLIDKPNEGSERFSRGF